MTRFRVDRYVTMKRRQLLKGLAGSAALTLGTGALSGCTSLPSRSVYHPFNLGIASGEPAADGMVLWTHISPSPGLRTQAIPVTWDIAHDEHMIYTVQSGETVAHPDLGHSVHVEVEGLAPEREYFYRFQVGGDASPVGRTKTTPLVDAPVNRLRFAVCGCQRRDEGHYTAFQHLAKENVDFVYHYGDYVYESLWNRSQDLARVQLDI